MVQTVARERTEKYHFDDFVLLPRQRVLLHDGSPVALTPKPFSTLLLLVERAGETVSKEEMLATVWNSTAVEENSLSQSISAIRKALGEKRGENRYIITDPGRGYRFVAPITRVPEEPGTDVRTANIPEKSPIVTKPISMILWSACLTVVLLVGATMWLRSGSVKAGLADNGSAANSNSDQATLAETEVRWARSRVRTGQVKEAMEQIRQAVPVARRALPPDSVRLWDILHNAVHACNDAQDFRDADAYVQEAMAVTERMHLPSTSDRWGMLYWDLGRAKRGERNYDEAIAAFKKAELNFRQFPDNRTKQVRADIEETESLRDRARAVK